MEQEKAREKYTQRRIILRILRLLRPWRKQIIYSNVFGLLGSFLALFSLIAIFPILELIFTPTADSGENIRTAPARQESYEADENQGAKKVRKWTHLFDVKKDQLFDRVSEWSVRDPARTLLTIGIMLVVFSILRFAAEYISRLFMTRVETEFLHKLTKDLYDHVINHEYSFFRWFPPGKLITRLSLDIYRMQKFIEFVYVTRLKQPFSFIALLLMLFVINYKLAGIMVLFIPLFIIPGIYVSRRVRALSRREIGLDTEYVELIEEQFSGYQLVKTFAAEKKESGRYYVQLNDVFKRRRARQLLSAIGLPLQDLITTLMIITLVGLGYLLVFEYRIIEGNQLLFFLITASAMFRPVKKILDFNVKLQRPLISARAILDVLDTPKSEEYDDNAKVFPANIGSIAFQNVGFRYGSEEKFPWIFKDFNLVFRSNEIVALQGPNGSGKTTLALLLSGHYKPQEGDIMIGRKNLSALKRSEIRRNITLIQQEAILFSLSIAENIAFGIPPEKIDYEKIRYITEELGLSTFLDEMPEGIHTTLGIKENALSGGERQLIALCRAFYFDCPILILDEPTNNLDQQKVLLLIERLKRLRRDKLVLIITHNPALIEAADRLIVLQQGEIISDLPGDKNKPG